MKVDGEKKIPVFYYKHLVIEIEWDYLNVKMLLF